MAGRASRAQASPLPWAKETGRPETARKLGGSVGAGSGRKPPSSFNSLWEEICEQGFAKSIGKIGVDLREETQACRHEVKETTEALRDEFSCLKQLAPTVVEIVERLDQQDERARTAKIDFSPVFRAIQQGDTGCVDAFNNSVSQAELRILDHVDKVQQAREHDLLRRIESEFTKARESDDKRQEGITHNEEQLQRLMLTQETMAVDFSFASKGLRTLQADSVRLEQRLDAQFQKHIRDQPVKVDFSHMDSHMAHSSKVSTHHTKAIMTELAKIQQALSIDFASVIDDVSLQIKSLATCHTTDLVPGTFPDDMDEHTILPITPVVKKRVREMRTQTDEKETVDNDTQTDASLMKTVGGKKKGLPERKTDEVAKRNSGKAQKAVFADKDAMKAKMREAMIKVQYDVTDFYHETGCAQAIAKSPKFEQLTLVVIALNAAWIAVDIDYNSASVLTDAHPVFQVAENLFCIFFSFELLMRFLAFNGKRYCLKDGWFLFDTTLVSMMVVETWVITLAMYFANPDGSANLGSASMLRMIRIVRILRVSRMARLCRKIPELVIVIKGIGVASRSVGVFFALWFIIIYIFGVFFRQVTDGHDVGIDYFETVPESMNTLLLDALLPESSQIVKQLSERMPLLWLPIMFFIGLCSITIMYMLIGVLVEVVSTIATTEKEGMAVSHVASELRKAMCKAGKDTDDKITQFEFAKLLSMSEIASAVKDAGVDTIVLADMHDVIFEDPEKAANGLTFEQFVDLVLNMRGHNPATVKDVKEQVRVVKKLVNQSNTEGVEKVVAEITKLRDEMWELHAAAMQERSQADGGFEELAVGEDGLSEV